MRVLKVGLSVVVALLASALVGSFVFADSESEIHEKATNAFAAIAKAETSIAEANTQVKSAKTSVEEILKLSEPKEEEPPVEEPPTEEEPPPPPVGTVIFKDEFNSIPASHKTGNGWYSQCNTGRMTDTAGVVRFEVRTGDVETDTGNPRCELSGGGPDLPNGGEVWVSAKLRWGPDDTAQPSWELVQQWHDDGCCSPSVALFRYGQDVRFINGVGSPVYWSGKSPQRGVWHTLTYRYIASTSSNGLVESWWDGVFQGKFTGKTLNSSSAYLKIGSHSSASRSGTSVVEYDKITIGTTKAIVEA